jgi:hypothetical protein
MQRLLIAVLVLTAILFASTVVDAADPVNVPYSLCSKTDKYHYTITSMTAVTWPPTKGNPVNITANGTLDETITGGTYSAKATYEGFPLPSSSGDLSTIKAVPWAAGVFEFDYVFPIPSSAPSGKYWAQLSGVDQSKSLLFCIQLSFSLSAVGAAVEETNLRSRWQEVKKLAALMQ